MFLVCSRCEICFLYVAGVRFMFLVCSRCQIRVSTSSGNHGKPGKSQIKILCMEKSWNFIKAEKSWNFVKLVVKLTSV